MEETQLERLSKRSFSGGIESCEFEVFRPMLGKAVCRERKSSVSRPLFDIEMMFNILILQRLFNLSDNQTEYNTENSIIGGCLNMYDSRYPLSVIIPIHKSDLNIQRCVNSLLAIEQLNLQIIIAANSDSKEELKKINQKITDDYCTFSHITLLKINKGGKANAINKALWYVKNEVVLIGDADTRFCRKGLLVCLSDIVRDKTVAAISGNVDVYKRNFLSLVQHFEYRRIFRIFRPFWNHLNGNLLISGCAGIFRTKCLFDVGLYDTKTIGEDFEITLRLHDYYIRHQENYKIKYINATLAKTDAPLDLMSFIRQRGRWFCGFLEVTAKYRKIICHPIHYRSILIPYLWLLIFEKWFCYLKWFLIAISIGLCVYHGIFALTGILTFLLYFGIFEIALNSVFVSRLNLSRSHLLSFFAIGILTLVLIGLQFVLKDTNVFQSIYMNRTKENKW